MSLLETSAQLSGAAATNGRVHVAFPLATGQVAGLPKNIDLAALDNKQWNAWRGHLQRRKNRPSLTELTDQRRLGSLLWEFSDLCVNDETRDVLKHTASINKSKSAGDGGNAATITKAWLAERAAGIADASLAIEALAWAYQLPKLAGHLDAQDWCALLRALLAACHDASAIDPEEQPLEHQLLAGELGMTLAYALPEVEPCRRVAKPSRAALELGVLSLLDGEGEIAGRHLDIARPLLASWTRCALLGRRARKRVFGGDAATIFKYFVQQNLAAMRADGTPMLVDEGSWNKRLFAAAVDVSGKTAHGKIAKLVLPAGKRKSRSQSKTDKLLQRLPEPSASSEWAATALLRSSWLADSPRLLLDYSSENMRSELFVDNHVIWRGECSPRITVDGDRLAIDSDWQEVCWHVDEDVVYVEIEAGYDGGWKCQRQFLLDRRDRLFFVADALLGAETGDVEYACTWPVVDEFTIATEKETTECALAAGKKTIARVLPLALPEWKSDGRRSGALAPADGGLRYEFRSKAANVYVPLCLDLEPARMKYPYTWRRLSVGKDLQAVPPEEAVGYRVQLRLDQWLIYRSLAPVASRTVLGQNYFYEFVCGRLDRDGDVDPLIEVE